MIWRTLPPSIPRSRRCSGVALVVVLVMLVLFSTLLVAFMSTAQTEKASSGAASGAAAARQLADSTISLVISQIREATDPKSPDGTPDETATWASQPGAIRVFRSNLATQTRRLREGATHPLFAPGADEVFKLYSSERMRVPVTGDQIAPFADDIALVERWADQPDPESVDLNQPMLFTRRDLDPSGTTVEPRYPIIDPRALFSRTGAESSGPIPGVVEGFDAKLSFDNVLKAAPSSNVTPGVSAPRLPYLPLPVKWLYVLRDGSMFTASQLASQSDLTRDNPIVGRTAFWVDDETSKLNINTASEGTFWDTPTASSIQESGQLDGNNNLTTTPTGLSLAAAQPARLEYQRYPGHPATTCLSPALGWLWNLSWNTPVYPASSGFAYRNFKEAIYQMAPFIPGGNNTSLGATRKVDPDQVDDTGSRTIRTKHLYATVDEMVFRARRFQGATSDLNSPLNPAALEKMRFFLTAHSRAPDTNVFGRPRVSIWPVHLNPEFRTPFDELFHFASTVYRDASLTHHYSLLREDAQHPTRDIEPNTGKPQNRDMFAYLQWITGERGSGITVPGFGGNFAQKHTASERDQILVQIFDYVRCTNLVDTGAASRSGNIFVPYTPRYFRQGIIESYSRQARSFDWSGQVTPLRAPDSAATDFQGQGRFFTVQEVAIMFYNMDTANVDPKRMQAALLIEMATTTPGFTGLRPTYYTRVRPLPGREIGIKFAQQDSFTPIQLCGRASEWDDSRPARGLININNVSPHEVTFGRAFMPVLGFTAPLFYFPEHRGPTNLKGITSIPALIRPELDPNRNNAFPGSLPVKTFDNQRPESRHYVREGAGANPTVRVYPYVSDVINLGNHLSFYLSGGGFEIQIWAGESPDDPRAGGESGATDATGKPLGLVQTLYVEFPHPQGNEAAPLPIPGLTSRGPLRSRFGGSLDGDWNCIIAGADIVRSVEYAGPPMGQGGARGDLRLAAARSLIPKEHFEPRDGRAAYFSANRCVHGLQCAHGDPVGGHTGAGRLAQGGAFRASKPATIPRNIDGVRRMDGGPGDWDRGLSKHMSGAFINKVDEGNVRWNYADSSIYGRIPYFRGRAIEETGQTMFSPNRQLSSPVMLGSIPSGVFRGLPWQTLLFRPDRERGSVHPGAAGLPDHLWLDLFHMPVVEPYAISEPLSTAGKVNINYVAAPFGYASGAPGSAHGSTLPRSYLRRDSAVRGVLKPVFIMAIPTSARDGGHTENPGNESTSFRFPINLNRTLEHLEARLKAPEGSLFRTASEICTVDLYPEGLPVTDWAAFWNQQYALTGDNMRERPYSHIYPRITTRSNTYTVHLWTQTIRKSPASDPALFDPAKDSISGEYRGSALIERFIDPNDPELRDYNPKAERLDRYYRYRILQTKHFAPR
jgi:hypothetical protein